MAYGPVEDGFEYDSELDEVSEDDLSSEGPVFEQDTDVSMFNSPVNPPAAMEVDIPGKSLTQSSSEDKAIATRPEPARIPSPLPPGIVTPPRSPLPRPPTPPPPAFPPSPISNPATPPPSSPSQPSTSRRKRPRTTNWSPPAHVPAFLPPFPHASPESSPRATPAISLPEDGSSNSQPFADLLKLEHPPSPMIPPVQPNVAGPAPASTSTSADYMSIVPYALSSLAAQPTRHLPVRPSHIPPSTPASQLPIPDTQPALFGAYHHILTHKPSTVPTPLNTGRYKVALALVGQNESDVNPKWEPAPSLFGTNAPNMPRVATIGPTHAVPIGKEDGKGKEKEGAESAAEAKIPSMPTRPLPSMERVASLVSTTRPRIPQLAKQLLSVSRIVLLKSLPMQILTFLFSPRIPFTTAQHAWAIRQYSRVALPNSHTVLVYQHLGTRHPYPLLPQLPANPTGKNPAPRKTPRAQPSCFQTPGSSQHGIGIRRATRNSYLLFDGGGWEVWREQVFTLVLYQTASVVGIGDGGT